MVKIKAMLMDNKRLAATLFVILIAAIFVSVLLMGSLPNMAQNPAEAVELYDYTGYNGSAPAYTVRPFLYRSYRDYHSDYDDMVFGIRFSNALAQINTNDTIQIASLYYVPVASDGSTFTSDKNSGAKRTDFIYFSMRENFTYYSQNNKYKYPDGRDSTYCKIDMYQVFESLRQGGDMSFGQEYAIRCVVQFLSASTGNALNLYSSEFRFVYKERVAVPETPMREGYTFDGWYYNEELTSPYIDGHILHTDVALYSKYTINNYNVQYYIQGVKVFNGSVAYNTLLEAPVIVGHTFDGWFKDSLFTQPHDGVIKTDTVLYAKYTPVPYTVKVYGKDGVVVYSGIRNYGTEFNLGLINVPVIEGRTFGDFYYEPDYVNSVDTYLLTVNGDINIWIAYTVNKYTWNIYGFEGASFDSGEADYNSDIPEFEAPAVEGYQFVGWYANSNFTIPFTATKLTTNVNIYGKYTRLSFDYVVYGYNGQLITSGQALYNDELELEVPSLIGCDFIGWYTDSGFTTEWDGSPIISDITLYGKYVAERFDVRIYGIDGIIATRQLLAGDVVSAADQVAPELDGFTFVGWYVDAEYTVEFDFIDGIVSDTDIFAKYTGSIYEIKVYGFGDAFLYSINVNHGATVDSEVLNIPEVNGQEFVGFYRNAARTLAFDFVDPVVASLIIYLDYDVNVYTVNIYDISLNKKYADVPYSYGQTISKLHLTADAVEGKTFAGWYTDSNFITPYVGTSLVSANLSLYPKYTVNTFDYVVYGFSGLELHSGNLDYGEVIPSYYFVAPPVTGYTFFGWYKDNSYQYAYNASLPMSDDVNIYAKYTLNKYNITVYGYENMVLYNGVVDYASLVPGAALQVNPITGCYFDAFYIDAQRTVVFNPNSGIFANTSIYLNYLPNSYEYVVHGLNNVILTSGDVLYNELLPAFNPPVVEGYTFVGWYTDSSYSHGYNASLGISADTYIYAKYTNVRCNYSVFGSGGVKLAEGTLNYAQTVPAVVIPEIIGYEFTGWFYDSNFENAYDFATPISGDIMIFARYSQIYYDYIFYGLNNAVIDEGSVMYGAGVAAPAAPVVEGFTFDGWYIDVNYTTAFDQNAVLTSDVLIYGKYTAVPHESISTANTWKIIGGCIGLVLLVGVVFLLVKKFTPSKKRF